MSPTPLGPQDMKAFLPAMLDAFADGPGSAPSPLSAASSDPQRSSPPDLVTKAARWSPRPLTAALAGAGLAELARRNSSRR